MESISVNRLTDSKSIAFNAVCDWHYHWFGKRDKKTYALIKENLLHSLNIKKQLPQTYVAWIGNRPVGTYQFAMMDDVESRPDVYPWMISVFVDENYRGKGVFKAMMKTVKENAHKAGLKHVYLYTSYTGLYEKFGWKFIGPINTYRKNSSVERLYLLEIS